MYLGNSNGNTSRKKHLLEFLSYWNFALNGKTHNVLSWTSFPCQVHYEGNPENALVTFNSHSEANAAYRSTEAVLNNRFIKLFWHNPQVRHDLSKSK